MITIHWRYVPEIGDTTTAAGTGPAAGGCGIGKVIVKGLLAQDYDSSFPVCPDRSIRALDLLCGAQI